MTHSVEWPLEPADPDTFVGPAFIRLVGASTSRENVKVYYVDFQEGARTNWHAHAGEQILLVTVGRCRCQVQGEAPVDLAAGESIRFPAGVRHWHGATPGEHGEHIALNLGIRETSWYLPVTDEEYAATTSG